MRMTTGLSAVPAGTAITASCTVLYFALPSAATTNSTGAAFAPRTPPDSVSSTASAPQAVRLLVSRLPLIKSSLRSLRRVEAAPLLRRLDGDVLEAEGADVVHDFRRL